MNITKKIDRAFQWAGEKMGAEAKTSMSDDFRMLETEMALRYDGKSCLAPLTWAPGRHLLTPFVPIQAWTAFRSQ
jgi:hypothetical protein